VSDERDGRPALLGDLTPVTFRQLTLFGVEPRPLVPEQDSAGGASDPTLGTAAFPDQDARQVELFAEPAVLGREIEAALSAGRFELAAHIRMVLDQTYGPSLLTHDLGFLDLLGTSLWDRPPAEALSVWADIDGRLFKRVHRRDHLRVGVFARLLASHTPEALVEARPECLPALVAVLAAGQEGLPEAGRRRARALVRDALLAGRDLSSLDFDHDRAVADLLAEDLPPRWLACLGLIRRLWPAPPPDEGDLEGFRHTAAEVRSLKEAALEFWRCLQLADSADTPEEVLHEARRTMKRLRPELHALYMRRATVTRGS
jgi:hypothetical protein